MEFQMIRKYSSEAFQSAFRAYFEEMGIQVSNWEGLFSQMTEDAVHCILCRDDSGAVLGFIQFSLMDMTSWFFWAKCGFIQEFWVNPAQRNKGVGSALLERAEQWVFDRGLDQLLLTTDTAAAFYEKRGYRRAGAIRARNGSPVYIKQV